MELRHIELENLKPAAVNVRHSKKEPQIDDLLPSIRERGILQPLLVRPNGKGFEVVAGRRRYHAAKAIKEETGECAPLPCAIMRSGDDLAAVEASLLENIARLPMDPMDQYEAFRKLAEQKKSTDDIATTFGVTALHVRRILALANLIPPVKVAYRNDELDHPTLRLLTIGSKKQQRDWMKLFRNENAHEPRGHNLKRWLCGGADIKTDVALFDLSKYTGELVKDLFAEDVVFADSDQFWSLQEQAINARVAQWLEDGWSGVVVLERGAYFASWDYASCERDAGGKVFVEIKHSGEVTFHQGLITRSEARARERTASGEDGSGQSDKPPKPEITKAMQRYLELHRHAMVREDLMARPDMALCLIAAHIITGSGLWQVEAEPQKAPREDIKASVMASPAQTAFDKERADILKLLELDETRQTLVRPNFDAVCTVRVFLKLLKLTRQDIERILIFAMAETLQSGSPIVEVLGVLIGTSPRSRWQADEVFLDLLKNKKAINAVLADIAENEIAKANIKATGKVQKSIIADCLKGQNGRRKIENWTPHWLTFPIGGYTEKPITATSMGSDWQRVKSLMD